MHWAKRHIHSLTIVPMAMASQSSSGGVQTHTPTHTPRASASSTVNQFSYHSPTQNSLSPVHTSDGLPPPPKFFVSSSSASSSSSSTSTSAPLYRSMSKSTALSLDDFDLISLLGEGAFGKVLMVRHKPTSKVSQSVSARKPQRQW